MNEDLKIEETKNRLNAAISALKMMYGDACEDIMRLKEKIMKGEIVV